MQSEGLDERPKQELAAFERVIVRSRTPLIRFASKRLPDFASAEDALGDTYVAAWKRWMSGQPVTITWLYRVLAHKIADHYRADARGARAHDEAGRGRLPQAILFDHLDVLAVREAVARLPERERQTIHLTYWMGFAAAEVAHVLDLTEAHTWTILSRARRKLLRELQSQ